MKQANLKHVAEAARQDLAFLGVSRVENEPVNAGREFNEEHFKIATASLGGADIDIEVWLGDYVAGTDSMAFWVGFGRGEPIKRLRDLIPSGLTLHNQIEAAKIGDDAIGHPVYEEQLYRRRRYHWLGVYHPAGSSDVAAGVNFVASVIGSLDRSQAQALIEQETAVDIIAVANDPSLSSTSRARLVECRLGQGVYRRALFRLWGEKCAVTGIDQPELLRASHIKPWRLSTNTERLDEHNGLLLSANIDALFDKYLISFDDNGSLVQSGPLSNSIASLNLANLHIERSLSEKTRAYLREHRREMNRLAGRTAPEMDR